MANFELTQTGEQVQNILNDAPTTKTTAEQAASGLSTEITNRQNADATLQQNIDTEATTRGNADTTLQQNIDAEATTRGNAVNSLQNQITSEVTTRSNADTTLQNNIDAEETRARAAEQQNATDIDNIEAKIPAAASSSNQLADKAFVNSSIATNTANFRGTSATGLTYAQFLSWANGLAEKDANDYVFWNTEDANGNKEYQRYKYDGSAWAYEYTLNNSSFTAEQWAAISSGITSGDKTKLDALPTRAQLDALLAAKQGTLAFDTAPTANSTNPVYSGGIKSALDNKQSILSWDNQPTRYSDNPVKSGGLYDVWQAILTSISEEETRAKDAEQANADDIDGIEAKIPAQASSSNQLADKNFVNSSIATNTANYISNNGQPFASLTELQAYSGTLTNNDYAFVVGTDSAGNTQYTRYKYNATNEAWAEEYVLNNSSFTAAQWAAISSGITSGDKTKLDALPTRAQLETMLAAKQDTLTFDTAPTANSNNPVKSGGLYDIWQTILGNISSEATTRGNADTNLQNQITPIVDVTPQALTELYAMIIGIQKNLKNLGECNAVCIDSDNLPKVCGEPLVVTGDGAPSIVPMFVGQRYHDTTNKKVYEAMSVTNSTSDWVLLN